MVGAPVAILQMSRLGLGLFVTQTPPQAASQGAGSEAREQSQRAAKELIALGPWGTREAARAHPDIRGKSRVEAGGRVRKVTKIQFSLSFFNFSV